MKRGALWQVSVTCSREAEEAVAALLERLFGQPATVYIDELKQVSVATIYSSQRDQVSSKREALEAGLQFLSACQLNLGPATIHIGAVPREDWSQSWKKYFKRIEIGSALLIKPSWNRSRVRKGQAVVVLDPGLSFGTGQHPTTAFCLEQLVLSRKNGQSRSVLDIGTGSGILAISAVKLGYHPVRALDYDPTAVRVAKANARKNRVEHKLGITRQDLTRLPLASRFRHDIVCANLTEDLLMSQSARIVNRLKAGGRLVLAGILASQFAGVQELYRDLGLKLLATRAEGGWQSGSFVAPA